MNSAMGPNFKVVFAKKVFVDPVNSACDPLEKSIFGKRSKCTSQTCTKETIRIEI